MKNKKIEHVVAHLDGFEVWKREEMSQENEMVQVFEEGKAYFFIDRYEGKTWGGMVDGRISNEVSNNLWVKYVYISIIL